MLRLRCAALALLSLIVAVPAAADETLVLKDGRRIVVTRLARRAGKVRLETKDGKVFEVAEDQVVSPPLESIPLAEPKPTPAQEATQVLELKDGRKISVRSLARRGNLVLFETAKGERFSVPEQQVVSPPLASIPIVEPKASPPPAPAPEPGIPVAPPEPVPVAPPPAPPVKPPAPAAPPRVPATILATDEFAPSPDRWDVLDRLAGDPRIVRGRLTDPYDQNVLKGDKPVIGDSVFLVLTGVLDTPSEVRRLPVPSGVSAEDPGRLEFFGRGRQVFATPRAFASAELFRGQTAFKPKTWALKLTGAFNLNTLRVDERNVVNIDVREGTTRRRQDASLEEAFAEVKLADLSHFYDFVSLRAGIQPFVSDARGFVFSDSNLGARLFGNLANNRWQYNVAVFDLLEKETNSELNLFEKREQTVLVANLFRQDVLAKGYTLSLSYHRSRDEASTHYDANDFLVRPAKIGTPRPHEVTANYVGIVGDGHIGRLNLTHAFYQVFGRDEHHPLADREQDVSARMAALELSIDKDWARFKASAFYASGDDDPTDGRASGFDAVYDKTNFAGGPFSFWTRSGIPLTQTGVLLKTPESLLPSLRSNKFEGQANYVNPGVLLLGAGLDLELTPKLKAVMNANYLRFDKTGALDLLLFQPGIRKSIGFDLGTGVLYRPLLNENVVILAGLTGLLPGAAFDDLYSSTCGVPQCGAPSRKLFNTFLSLKLTY